MTCTFDIEVEVEAWEKWGCCAAVLAVTIAAGPAVGSVFGKKVEAVKLGSTEADEGVATAMLEGMAGLEDAQ